MNIIHAIRRATGLHPRRRKGEPHYDSTAAVIAAIRADLYQRRHDDVVGQARAAFAMAAKLAETDGTVKKG